ncbi:hypothetical protein EDB19DRAFT_1909043 [Suillus lakei]|nr:hypothetical protein EDB19DRAFT_1909043 [Suillus lakei]
MFPSLDFFYDLWVRKTLSAAGHTVLVYDYFLTINDEIWYIWNAPWTVVKVIFLINRYGNLAGQTLIRLEEAGLLAHNQLFCQRYSLTTSFFMILSSESIHILVLVRAWAIWGTQRGMTKFLVGSYVFCVLILLGAATYGAKHDSSEEYEYLDLAKVCVSAMPSMWLSFLVCGLIDHHFKEFMWLCWLGSFILDAAIFVLTTRSLWRYSREFRGLYPSNLLHVLVRDATMFFVDPNNFLPKGFSGPLLSVAGQRLVLNLKGLSTRSYSTHELSREVDRQLEAFAEAYCLPPPDRDNLDDPEGGRELQEM